MKNLAIDQTTGDLLLSKGQIGQVFGADAAGQVVSTDLKTFLGEFWLDRSFGIPYYELVFKKTTDLSAIKTMYIEKILARPEILKVTRFDMDVNGATRKLRIVLGMLTSEGFVDNIVVEV